MKTSWLVLAAIMGAFLLNSTPPARGDDASRLQAARDLLAASHMDVSYSKTIDQILDAQMKGNPALAQVRQPMKEFLDKYMGWDAMKEDLAKIYADNFTEQELHDIINFYRTPTGSKMALAVPNLVAQGAALGQRRVAEHMDELRQMIQKALANGSGGAPGATPSPAPAPASAPADH